MTKTGHWWGFFSLWLQAALAVTPAFLVENHIEPDKDMTDYVLRAMGVEDGKVDPRGALAYKSYQEIAADICQALEKKGITLDPARAQEQLERLFDENVTGKNVSYTQVTDIKKMLAGSEGEGYLRGTCHSRHHALRQELSEKAGNLPGV